VRATRSPVQTTQQDMTRVTWTYCNETTRVKPNSLRRKPNCHYCLVPMNWGVRKKTRRAQRDSMKNLTEQSRSCATQSNEHCSSHNNKQPTDPRTNHSAQHMAITPQSVGVSCCGASDLSMVVGAPRKTRANHSAVGRPSNCHISSARGNRR